MSERAHIACQIVALLVMAAMFYMPSPLDVAVYVMALSYLGLSMWKKWGAWA